MTRHLPKITRQSIIESIKTLMWVVPLTLLIWIYAEREQIADDPNVAFPIAVRSNDPNRVATLLTPQDRNVTVTLSGPRAKLQAIKSILSGGPEPTPLTLEIAATATGQSDPLAAPLLSAQQIFHDYGVTVKSCSPANLRINIDDVIEREARVVAPPTVTNLESPPVFDPPTVTLRGPRGAIEAISRRDERGKLTIAPDLTGIEELRLPGVHNLSNLPLYPANSAITVKTKTVNAVFTIKQSNIDGRLSSVPIFLYVPRSLLDEYKVELPSGETLPNVRISGPPDKIKALQDGTLTKKPTAMLRVSRDDAATGGGRRAPEFQDLPEGVSIQDIDKGREIEFKLTKRSALAE